jgi:hypothetical protein
MLIDLPNEINQQHIIDYLDFPSNVLLKMTCGHFNAFITALGHRELMEAETSDFCLQKDLYACCDCLRLRTKTKFADNIARKRRGRSRIDSAKRFCVDCGVNPREGTTRYTAGSHIVVQGELYVICRSCRIFAKGAGTEGGRNISVCQRCWEFSRAIRLRDEEHHARQERARLRAEQALKRAQKREIWGSEYETSDDDISPSPTWSDIQLEMVQAEANLYMNSPKAGSE